LVDVTPGGILSALMLYFLPQYRQAIFKVPETALLDCAGFDAGEASEAIGFSAILWPQDLQRMRVAPSGMALVLILSFLLQY
jgi:hypothetical protein